MSSFATVQDVENRLGDILTTDEASAMDFWLSDVSVIITAEIVNAGKQVADYSADLLRMITSRLGVEKYLQEDWSSGVASVSQSMGGMAQSVSYNTAARRADDFELPSWAAKLLGIAGVNSQFLSIRLEVDC